MSDPFDTAHRLMVAANIPPEEAKGTLITVAQEAFLCGYQESTTLLVQATQNIMKRALVVDDPLRALFLKATGPGAVSAYEAWAKERGDLSTVRAWQAFFQSFLQTVTAEAETLADAEDE